AVVLRATPWVFTVVPATGLPIFPAEGVTFLAGTDPAIFAALERAAAGTLALLGAGDFTALLLAVFLPILFADLLAAATDFLTAVVTFLATVFFAVDMPVPDLALLEAGGLGADFFALFTAFVTVAFIFVVLDEPYHAATHAAMHAIVSFAFAGCPR